MAAMVAMAVYAFQIVVDAAAAVVAAAVHRPLHRSVRADGRPRAEQGGRHSDSWALRRHWSSSDRSSLHVVIELHVCWRLRCCRHRRSHCIRRLQQLRQRRMSSVVLLPLPVQEDRRA